MAELGFEPGQYGCRVQCSAAVTWDVTEIKIGQRLQGASVRMGFGVPVCPQIISSDLGVRSLARPVLAIPDVLSRPLTEVRSNSRSSTPAAAYQTNNHAWLSWVFWKSSWQLHIADTDSVKSPSVLTTVSLYPWLTSNPNLPLNSWNSHLPLALTPG